MTNEYWTERYTPARIASTPIKLKAPLTRTWTYKPRGVGLGCIRAGDGAVFTSFGHKCYCSRVGLEDGKLVWKDKSSPVSLIVRWKSDLLVYGNGLLRCLDFASGSTKWSKEARVGVSDSFVKGAILVGTLADRFHAIDLDTIRELWSIPEHIDKPLVSDGDVVVRAEDDVLCLDLLTGKLRWRRPGADFGGAAHLPGCIWEGQFIGILGDSLTSLDVATGRTLWRWKEELEGALHWWYPYAGRAYFFTHTEYFVLDLATREVMIRRQHSPIVPPASQPKKGFFGSRKETETSWRYARLVVSETQAFVTDASGKVVVLKRDTGEVEQVVEIDGMPIQVEPVIYENRLLLADFDATVYCFKGAD